MVYLLPAHGVQALYYWTAESAPYAAVAAAGGSKATAGNAVAHQIVLSLLLLPLLQVFAMFISSMTTYRPLLLRIKQAYDPALEDATGSAYDHVHLQAELSMVPRKHVG